MPKADPESWRHARTQWELLPDMTLTEVAASLNVSIPTVSQRATRDGWRKVAPIRIDLPPQTAAELATIAMRRLATLCDTTKDEHVAIKAASVILDHTLGKPSEARAPLQPLPETEQDWPEWLTARRLAYQEGQGASQETLEAPSEPEPLPEPAPPPVAQLQRPPAPSPLPSPFPRPQPQMWDGPGKPASAAVRDSRG